MRAALKAYRMLPPTESPQSTEPPSVSPLEHHDSQKESKLQEGNHEKWEPPSIKAICMMRRGHSLCGFSLKDDADTNIFESAKNLPPRRTNFAVSLTEKNSLIQEQLRADKIDLSKQSIQNLTSEVSRKPVKTKIQRKFLLNVFLQSKHFAFLPVSGDFDWLIEDILYASYEKDEIIYETGDFGLHYFLLISGELAQLLPTSEEVVNSPMRLARKRKFVIGNATEHTITNPSHKKNKAIRPGEHFGETELLSRQRRQSTIVSSTISEVLKIGKETFEKIFGESKNERITKRLEFLRQFEFFASISNIKLLTLMDAGETLELSSQAILFEEAQRASKAYFIIEGEVQVLKTLSDKDEDIAQSLDAPSHQQQANNLSSKQNGFLKRTKRKVTSATPIIVLTENSCFGIEDFLLRNDTIRSTQAVVVSEKALLFTLNIELLVNIIRKQGNIGSLQRSLLSREEYMNDRIQWIIAQRQSQQLSRDSPSLLFSSNSRTTQSGSRTSQIPLRLEIISSTIHRAQSLSRSSSQLFQTESSEEINISSQLSSPAKQNSPNSSLRQIEFPKRSPLPFQPSSLHSHQRSSFFSQKSFEIPQMTTLQIPRKNSFNDHLKKIATLNSSDSLSPITLSPIDKQCPPPVTVTLSSLSPVLRRIVGRPSAAPASIFFNESVQHTKPKEVFPAQYFVNLSVDNTKSHHKKHQKSLDFSIKQKEELNLSFSTNSPSQYYRKNDNNDYLGTCQSTTNIIINRRDHIRQTLSNSSRLKSNKKLDVPSHPSQLDLSKTREEVRNSLFENFIEVAEQKVLKKQEIMRKLAQPTSQTNSNQPQEMPHLFAEEYKKGFNQMCLRKFGKKFAQKLTI